MYTVGSILPASAPRSSSCWKVRNTGTLDQYSWNSINDEIISDRVPVYIELRLSSETSSKFSFSKVEYVGTQIPTEKSIKGSELGIITMASQWVRRFLKLEPYNFNTFPIKNRVKSGGNKVFVVYAP